MNMLGNRVYEGSLYGEDPVLRKFFTGLDGTVLAVVS